MGNEPKLRLKILVKTTAQLGFCTLCFYRSVNARYDLAFLKTNNSSDYAKTDVIADPQCSSTRLCLNHSGQKYNRGVLGTRIRVERTSEIVSIREF